MNSPTIECPHCEGEITLSETLAAEHIKAAQAVHRREITELKASHTKQVDTLNQRELHIAQREQQVQQTLNSERDELTKKIKHEVRKDLELQLKDADRRIAEKNAKLREAENLELESRKRMADADEKSRMADLEVQRRLDEQRNSLEKANAEREAAVQKQLSERVAALAVSEQKMAQTIESERQKMSAEIRTAVEKDVNTRILSADAQIANLDEKLKAAQATELESLKRLREADEKVRESELEVQRKLDSEKKQIREQALKEANEENQRALAEKDKHLEQVNAKVEEMKRQIESRSQQLQGELEEVNVYSRLKEAFPNDEVVRTERGRNGADIELRVKSPSGKVAGTVLIEVKDTQNFDRKWLGKLKEDMQTHQAITGVIVSRSMPTDIDTFSQRDGVWVSRIDVVVPLLSALRCEVLGIFRERNITALSDSAKDRVFDYLTSAEFARHISSLVDNHQAIYDSIALQKRQFNKRINEQIHALDNMFVGISNVYNDLGLRVGGSLKPVQGLEVDDLPDSTAALVASVETETGSDSCSNTTAA